MIVTRDMQFLVGLANDPSIFPYISWDGCDRIALEGDMVGVHWEDGGFVLHQCSPTVVEIHTLFPRKSKGVDEKVDQAIGYAFEQGAEAVITRIPDDLPHVKRLARRHGFELFAQHESWIRKGKDTQVGYYQLTRERYQELQKCQPQP